jgi:hypothetical protein
VPPGLAWPVFSGLGGLGELREALPRQWLHQDEDPHAAETPLALSRLAPDDFGRWGQPAHGGSGYSEYSDDSEEHADGSESASGKVVGPNPQGAPAQLCDGSWRAKERVERAKLDDLTARRKRGEPLSAGEEEERTKLEAKYKAKDERARVYDRCRREEERAGRAKLADLTARNEAVKQGGPPLSEAEEQERVELEKKRNRLAQWDKTSREKQQKKWQDKKTRLAELAKKKRSGLLQSGELEELAELRRACDQRCQQLGAYRETYQKKQQDKKARLAELEEKERNDLLRPDESEELAALRKEVAERREAQAKRQAKCRQKAKASP